MHANDPPEPGHSPHESDLYIPRKASSEVWRAFRLSYADQSRAWCTVCRLWLTWKKTTSNLLLHCHTWHDTDEEGRITRINRPARFAGTQARGQGASTLGRRDRSGSTVAQPSPDTATLPVAAKTPTGEQNYPQQQYGPGASSSAAPTTAASSPVATGQVPAYNAVVNPYQRTADIGVDASGFPATGIAPLFPFSMAALGNLAAWQTHDTAGTSGAGDVPIQLPGEPLAESPAARLLPSTSVTPLGTSLNQLMAEETVRFLVRDMLPPTILDGEGFQIFSRVLNAEYHPPSQQTLVSELEALHSRTSDQVALFLSRADKFALSVEVWPPSSLQYHFATVNAHCLDPDTFQPKTFTLLVYRQSLGVGTPRKSPKEENRTSDGEIANAAVAETIDQWKIDPKRIIAVTSATPSKPQSARLYTRIHCIADMLQQTIGQALFNHETSIRRVMAEASLEGVIFDSNVANWLANINSIRLCVKAAVKPVEALRDDLAVVESLYSVLKPVRQAVEPLSVCDFAPLGLARRQLELIVDAATKVSIGRNAHPAVRQTTFQIAQDVSDALSRMTADHAESMILCSILDPCTQSLDDEYKFTVLRRHCCVELNTDAVTGEEHGGVTREETSSTAEKEVRAFLAGDASSEGESMDEWWAARKEKFPVLSRIVRKVMAVSSTCMPASRAFRELTPASSVGNRVAQRRKLLCQLSTVSPAYIQTAAFLNNNLSKTWV